MLKKIDKNFSNDFFYKISILFDQISNNLDQTINNFSNRFRIFIFKIEGKEEFFIKYVPKDHNSDINLSPERLFLYKIPEDESLKFYKIEQDDIRKSLIKDFNENLIQHLKIEKQKKEIKQNQPLNGIFSQNDEMKILNNQVLQVKKNTDNFDIQYNEVNASLPEKVFIPASLLEEITLKNDGEKLPPKNFNENFYDTIIENQNFSEIFISKEVFTILKPKLALYSINSIYQYNTKNDKTTLIINFSDGSTFEGNILPKEEIVVENLSDDLLLLNTQSVNFELFRYTKGVKNHAINMLNQNLAQQAEQEFFKYFTNEEEFIPLKLDDEQGLIGKNEDVEEQIDTLSSQEKLDERQQDPISRNEDVEYQIDTLSSQEELDERQSPILSENINKSLEKITNSFFQNEHLPNDDLRSKCSLTIKNTLKKAKIIKDKNQKVRIYLSKKTLDIVATFITIQQINSQNIKATIIESTTLSILENLTTQQNQKRVVSITPEGDNNRIILTVNESCIQDNLKDLLTKNLVLEIDPMVKNKILSNALDDYNKKFDEESNFYTIVNSYLSNNNIITRKGNNKLFDDSSIHSFTRSLCYSSDSTITVTDLTVLSEINNLLYSMFSIALLYQMLDTLSDNYLLSKNNHLPKTKNTQKNCYTLSNFLKLIMHIRDNHSDIMSNNSDIMSSMNTLLDNVIKKLQNEESRLSDPTITFHHKIEIFNDILFQKLKKNSDTDNATANTEGQKIQYIENQMYLYNQTIENLFQKLKKNSDTNNATANTEGQKMYSIENYLYIYRQYNLFQQEVEDEHLKKNHLNINDIIEKTVDHLEKYQYMTFNETAEIKEKIDTSLKKIENIIQNNSLEETTPNVTDLLQIFSNKQLSNKNTEAKTNKVDHKNTQENHFLKKMGKFIFEKLQIHFFDKEINKENMLKISNELHNKFMTFCNKEYFYELQDDDLNKILSQNSKIPIDTIEQYFKNSLNNLDSNNVIENKCQEILNNVMEKCQEIVNNITANNGIQKQQNIVDDSKTTIDIVEQHFKNSLNSLNLNNVIENKCQEIVNNVMEKCQEIVNEIENLVLQPSIHDITIKKDQNLKDEEHKDLFTTNTNSEYTFDYKENCNSDNFEYNTEQLSNHSMTNIGEDNFNLYG